MAQKARKRLNVYCKSVLRLSVGFFSVQRYWFAVLPSFVKHRNICFSLAFVYSKEMLLYGDVVVRKT